MKITHTARILLLGTFLSLSGQALAENPAPVLENPPLPAVDTTDGVAKPEVPAAKPASQGKRSSPSTRSARRQGDGPQDRSERAKRHQGRMMAQSARRPGSMSRHASKKH